LTGQAKKFILNYVFYNTDTDALNNPSDPSGQLYFNPTNQR